MEHHHFRFGKSYLFVIYKWANFQSYVKLAEGKEHGANEWRYGFLLKCMCLSMFLGAKSAFEVYMMLFT